MADPSVDAASKLPDFTGPELGTIGRLINVFVAPSKTFESIARRPGWDWVVPILLVAAAVLVFQSATLPKIDVESAVAQQLKFAEKFMGEVPEAQREETEEGIRAEFEAQKSLVRRLFIVPILFALVFFVPAIYFGIAAAFGKLMGYMRLVAGYAYTWTIYIVPTLLASVVAWSKESLDSNDVNFYRVLKCNVAAFLDFDTTHKALLAILSSVDVFDIWGYIVGSIAVSKLTRFSPKGAALLVGGVWGVYILIKVLLAFVFQSFDLSS